MGEASGPEKGDNVAAWSEIEAIYSEDEWRDPNLRNMVTSGSWKSWEVELSESFQGNTVLQIHGCKANEIVFNFWAPELKNLWPLITPAL